MRTCKKILILFLSMLFLITASGIGFAEETEQTPVRKPFKSLRIPGDIRGCDFDEGGLGVGYHTNNTQNHGSVLNYRPGEKMTMYQPASMGITVSFSNGEWTEYTVYVQSAGTYDLVARYSAADDSGKMKVMADGEQLLEFNFKSTGGHTSPKTAYMGSVKLTAGQHVIRYAMTGGGITFEKITFYKAVNAQKASFTKTEGAYKKHVLPTTINAEDYDMGENGSVSNTTWRSDALYRSNNGIEIQKTGIDDYHIILKNGQSVRYTIEVLEDDVYSLRLLSKSSGIAEVSFNDSEPSQLVSLKPNEEASAGGYYLARGTHVLTVKSVELNLHLERLILSRGDSEADAPEDNTPPEVPVYKEFFVATDGSDEADGSFYAPFLTLERARDAARDISADMTGDIVIHIMPGFYQRNNTFMLGMADGGKNGYDIVYKGYNALEPPILSGGKKVTGWQEGENGIYSAHLPDVADMRQLYIDGCVAQRAQCKYTYTGIGYWDDPETDYTAEDGIVFARANFPVFSKPQDAEMVSNLLWTNQRTPIKDVVYTEDSAIVKFDQPYFYWHRTKSMSGTNPAMGTACYFENSMDFLDEAGEFYFDKDSRVLYYKPYPQEDMNRVEAYIGQLEFMVKIEGNSYEEKVQNIRFENIDFRHGTWYEPNERGLSDFQADAIVDGPNAQSTGMKTMPGQLHANFAEGIQILNCRFINVGSNAIVLEKGILHSKIEGNLIRDIAGGGITVGSFKHRDEPPENTTRYVDVKNNVIHRTGQEYMSTCAISIYYVQFVNLIHNDIKDLPYTGISHGWGWEAASADCTNIVISHNRIVNISRAVRDGGHIYGVGKKSNIKIMNNYIVSSEDFGGIYFDTYSRGTEVRNNVAEECQFWLFGGTKDYSWDIVAKDNYSDSAATNFLDNDPNGYYWNVPNDIDGAILKGEDGWPPEAQKIIDESGVEPDYRYMLHDFAFPEWRVNRIHNTRTKPYASPKIQTIWAKDYMEGGEGVAYHKNEPGAKPRLYKQQTKYVVGGTAAGEWLCYKFNSSKTQAYDVELCCANYGGGADESGTEPKANVYLDGQLLWEKIPIPDTGSWQAHVPFVAGNTVIEGGEHTIKVEFVDNGFSFESIIIRAEGSDKTDAEYDDGAPQY